jgi:hypothetical protein
MRPLSDRELLLQNLLAMGSVLLFRSAQAMRSGDRATQIGLVIECEAWFSETRVSLSQVLNSEDSVGSGTSAPPAESAGVKWNSPPGDNTSSPSSPANSTEPPTESEDTSSPPSSGGLKLSFSPENPGASPRSSTPSPLDWFLIKR